MSFSQFRKEIAMAVEIDYTPDVVVDNGFDVEWNSFRSPLGYECFHFSDGTTTYLTDTRMMVRESRETKNLAQDEFSFSSHNPLRSENIRAIVNAIDDVEDSAWGDLPKSLSAEIVESTIVFELCGLRIDAFQLGYLLDKYGDEFCQVTRGSAPHGVPLFIRWRGEGVVALLQSLTESESPE